MKKNDSLKEYYVKLHELYQNAVNMLTAINQSFSTNASEVTVDVADTDDTHTSVRIPSFLYLENKLEQLDMNFNSLFNVPESGEAWFRNASDMFKLQLVKSTCAPLTPTFTKTSTAISTPNWFLKDLVSPKPCLRLVVNNLPDNIQEMYMKKIVIFDQAVFNVLNMSPDPSYAELKAKLYNYNEGVDYEEYDTVLNLPLKRDEFISEFKITEIPYMDGNNPYLSGTLSQNGHEHLEYRVRFDTLTYTDQEDTSIVFTLKTGDYVCLKNANCVYKVKNVNAVINEESGEQEGGYVILEEYIGHMSLQTFEDNQNMIFGLYNKNYNKYHYVDVPLEENPYICVFLGTVYNNVRSNLSNGYLLDLNTIEMVDANGNKIYDNDKSTPMTYMQYYKKYCKNIGDLILGLTETAYPQISNYSPAQLHMLTEDDVTKAAVENSLSEGDLIVERINKHLIDDETTKEILNTHKEKSSFANQLTTVQSNIDQVYNTLKNTDFNQEIIITQESLRSKLNEYYQQRISLQTQQMKSIDKINSLRGDAKGTAISKYRIRGISRAKDFIGFIKKNVENNCEVIGMDIEYKYKSVTSDTTSITNINNNNEFSDWIKQSSIERERFLSFDEETNNFEIDFVNYDTNIIKWNQIDIPIRQGEDVVIRIRYKYNVGQPFINLYSPWSDPITMSFPAEFEEDIELSNILSQNDEDTTQAAFSKTLINEGYTEHISNKLVDNSQIFFHQPENIYSGFNTPENKLISLKDKLTSMTNDLQDYKTLMENELNANYKVYLTWDNNTVELNNFAENNILINDMLNNTTDSFVRKEMNIVIRNMGEVPINFYSIFPGNTDTALLEANQEFYNDRIINYERVPILYGKSQIPNQNIMTQKLGQWVYFRATNPWTNEMMYVDDETQNIYDMSMLPEIYNNDGKLKYNINFTSFINSPKQAQLAKRDRQSDTTKISNELIWDEKTGSYTTATGVPYKQIKESKYIYDVSATTNFLLKFEHFYVGNEDKPIYLSSKETISNVLQHTATGFELNDFNGAFLIPQVINENALLCDTYGKTQYKRLESGKSFTIPIIFEYYLNGQGSAREVTKTLMFDLRSTILQNPEHYIINIKGVNNYTLTNVNISNITSLTDKLINN